MIEAQITERRSTAEHPARELEARCEHVAVLAVELGFEEAHARWLLDGEPAHVVLCQGREVVDHAPTVGTADPVRQFSAMVRSMTRTAYLVDGIRSPFGRYGGGLGGVRADDLAATV